MMRQNVLIYGGGHLGRQIVHHIRHYTDARILGFIDDTRPAGDPVTADLQCVGGLHTARTSQEYGPANSEVVFAIGYADMRARKLALDNTLQAGYTLASVVHPRAIVEPGATLGQGAIVLGGAVIDQHVVLGDACYVDIGVRIGEDTVVGSNNYFSSGSVLGGAVSVGDSNFFGMDVTVTTGVKIGANCFVNAKSLVSQNLADGQKLVQVHKTRKLPN